MANIKNILSSIIDIQDKVISKLKYNHDNLNLLSGIVDDILDNGLEYTETDPVFAAQSGQFALKSEIQDLIDEELDPKFAAQSGQFALKSEIPDVPTLVSDFTNDIGYITAETDPVFAAQSGQFALKSEIQNLIEEELDPVFAAVSSQFALKSEIGTAVGEEFDPKFAAVSGTFALKSEIQNLIDEELDPKFEAVSGNFALKNELFSGSYEDLTDKPDIPAKLSDLTNDLNILTIDYPELNSLYSELTGSITSKLEQIDEE